MEFFDAALQDDGEWYGLYLVCPELGPGIAVNARLESRWKAWVLGHELGHHYHCQQGELFSPFTSIAHADEMPQGKRWGTWRKQDPEENWANAWAARHLIDAEEWAEVENRHPCDLRAILDELELPLPAAIAWERERRHSNGTGGTISVPLNSQQRALLWRSITGHGGHQAFFARGEK